MSCMCAAIVSTAAGAIAAPMLFWSVMPRSMTRPQVVCVSTTLARRFAGPPESITAPAPVTVHCAVGVR